MALIPTGSGRISALPQAPTVAPYFNPTSPFEAFTTGFMGAYGQARDRRERSALRELQARSQSLQIQEQERQSREREKAVQHAIDTLARLHERSPVTGGGALQSIPLSATRGTGVLLDPNISSAMSIQEPQNALSGLGIGLGAIQSPDTTVTLQEPFRRAGGMTSLEYREYLESLPEKELGNLVQQEREEREQQRLIVAQQEQEAPVRGLALQTLVDRGVDPERALQTVGTLPLSELHKINVAGVKTEKEKDTPLDDAARYYADVSGIDFDEAKVFLRENPEVRDDVFGELRNIRRQQTEEILTVTGDGKDQSISRKDFNQILSQYNREASGVDEFDKQALIKGDDLDESFLHKVERLATLSGRLNRFSGGLVEDYGKLLDEWRSKNRGKKAEDKLSSDLSTVERGRVNKRTLNSAYNIVTSDDFAYMSDEVKQNAIEAYERVKANSSLASDRDVRIKIDRIEEVLSEQGAVDEDLAEQEGSPTRVILDERVEPRRSVTRERMRSLFR